MSVATRVLAVRRQFGPAPSVVPAQRQCFRTVGWRQVTDTVDVLARPPVPLHFLTPSCALDKLVGSKNFHADYQTD
jgi:hypothetical protein